MQREPELISVYSAITATPTPVAINVENAKRSTIVLTEGGTVNNRSGALAVTGSVDGENFYALNMLVDNVTNTNAQTITRVASKTRSTAGTDLIGIDFTLLPVNWIKIALTITDGATPTGNFTVKLLNTY